jgi:xylan 1,4-beta-xylosidase
MFKRVVLSLFAVTLMSFPTQGEASAQSQPAETETVVVDLNAKTTPFPHFWENMFGSGRAILTLRESYRNDLRKVKKITDCKYVRFHNIFHDEVGIYNEDASGKPYYNWTYVDQIYDGLLANAVRPFVELSFMPNKMAASNMPHAFWYKPNVSPAKNHQAWSDMITAFAKHLIERYGADEVRQWYFEVWNEPNLDFWGGKPNESTYYELYDVTAKALKSVDSKLIVGGPATAQAAWVDRFIDHCVKSSVPVDFVSTHVYANDTADNVLGTKENLPRSEMVARAVRKVYDQVKASSMPKLPIIWSEYNASYMNEVDITDSAYMGPWLAQTIAKCDGLANEMALWTFSDVFEEQGIAKRPFYGGFGLIAPGGIPKAAFNAMFLLHALGTERIPVNSNTALATRRADGTSVIAVWNYIEPGSDRKAKTIVLNFKGPTVKGTTVRVATVQTIDDEHGSPLSAWRKMGAPDFPSQEQQSQLIEAAATPAPAQITLSADNTLTLDLQPNALAVVQLKN